MTRDKKLYAAFYSQRHSARLRNIEFLLTYEEWLQIWIDSGHLSERGRKKDQYVMARFGDKGPYAVGNVKIVTANQNMSEAHIGKPKSLEFKKFITERNHKRFESQEARDRVAESNRRRIVSEETKEKIASKLRGRKLTDEHKRNIQIGMGRV